MITDRPNLITLSKVGQRDLGYLTAIEGSALPFLIRRVYWTYFTPDSVVRGNHAHRELQQLIIAVSGRISMRLEGLSGQNETFLLDSPNIGLYIPRLYWRTIEMSHNAVLLCLASLEYSEDDYIRQYEEFCLLKERCRG